MSGFAKRSPLVPRPALMILTLAPPEKLSSAQPRPKQKIFILKHLKSTDHLDQGIIEFNRSKDLDLDATALPPPRPPPASLPIMGLLVHIAMRTPITPDFSVCMDKAMHTEKFAHAHDHCFDFLCA